MVIDESGEDAVTSVALAKSEGRRNGSPRRNDRIIHIDDFRFVAVAISAGCCAGKADDVANKSDAWSCWARWGDLPVVNGWRRKVTGGIDASNRETVDAER